MAGAQPSTPTSTKGSNDGDLAAEDRPPSLELPLPHAFDDAAQDDLPTDVQADFAPLSGAVDEPGHPVLHVDPFRDDSQQAQEAFDAAVAAAELGAEDAAIQQYLRAAKIAESAREWYLAAVACRRVGDYLLDPRPPFDIERAFRMYRRAVAAYEESGHFSEARELAYRQTYLKMRHARRLDLPVTRRVELFLHWAIAGSATGPSAWWRPPSG
jgi:tetratricopeptide (TPR) repeat protein